MEENVVIKAIKGLALGVCGGIVLSVIVYIVCFILELGNCACNILSCNWQGSKMMPGMWNWQTFWTVFIIVTVCCTVIGTVGGVFIGLQDMKDEEERRRKQAAAEEERRRKQNAADIQMAVIQQQGSIQTMKKDVYSYRQTKKNVV